MRMKESLSLAERQWPDQPRVAGSLSTLAQVYVAQKKYSDAEPLYRRAIVILEKSLGPDSPELAPTLETYALLLRDLGRPAEAKEMEARAGALKAKAPEQQWQQQINDGFSAFQQGRLSDAERMLREAVREIEQILPRHPLIIRALEALAQVCEEQGTLARAEPLYQRSIKLREEIFGLEGASLQGTLEAYARLLRKLDRVSEAEKLEGRAEKIRAKNAAKGAW
jgi:tetratricopeptide (TPR) repeat protein